MRISLLALFFAVFCSLLIGAENQRKPQNPENKPESQQGTPQEKTSSVPAIISGQTHTEERGSSQQKTKEEPKPFMTHGEWVMAILTSIYVAISAFGLIFIYLQGRTAKEAAEAASKNALALMNAERAWVMVNVRRNTEMGIPGQGGRDSEIDPVSIPKLIRSRFRDEAGHGFRF